MVDLEHIVRSNGEQTDPPAQSIVVVPQGFGSKDIEGAVFEIAFLDHLPALAVTVIVIDGLGTAIFSGAPGEEILDFCHRQQRIVSRSEEHTSELQSLMRISYAVFCLKKKTI